MERSSFIFDGHCDVLYKLWLGQEHTLFLNGTEQLHSSFHRLKEGRVKIQTMAVFVPPDLPKELKLNAALKMIDIFYEYVLADEQVELLTSAEQLRSLSPDDGKLYVLLALEGADPLLGDLTYLRHLYRLGVRSVGFTWNYRNEAADGVLERNPAGLSTFGMNLLAEMNRLGMAVDISHLAEQGFWDSMAHSTQPIMASHCNASALCQHPRNLSDEQIKAIFSKQGLIGVNFVPYFLTKDETVTIDHVLAHLDHMLALGGEDFIGIGSDFDGIDSTVNGLEHSGKFINLIEACEKRYSSTVVQKILFENWKNYYLRLWDESLI
jgi:membrane dipeptidase